MYSHRFVELCARSNFSFLQAASHPEELIEQALSYGYDGMGLCDQDGLYGVVRAFQAFTAPSFFSASPSGRSDFRFHVGCEVSIGPVPAGRVSSATAGVQESRLRLMPKSILGYQNLCRLLTEGKRNAPKGSIALSWDQIATYSPDLIAFCSIKDYPIVDEIFSDDCFVPVVRDLTWSSRSMYQQALHLEKNHQAQLFATQMPCMHIPARKPVLDVLTCLRHHCRLHEAGELLASNSERHLKNLPEIFDLWKDRLDLVEKSWDISRSLNFTLDEIRYRYPESLLPRDHTKTSWLQMLAQQGLQKRLPLAGDAVWATLHRELRLIQELEYEDYFLTLYEICSFAVQKNILFQGRGSAANSVVCFALGLTSVDPTKIDLLFERFISKERGEPPDIDIDFEHSRREEVIQHIYQKYGSDHAAMVCTVIRFKTRLAIRETCKVFDIPTPHVNQIIKYMGRDGLRRLVEPNPLPQQLGISEANLKLILHLAQELHGFPRHLGIHTGGFLITHRPITEIVPVEKATMNSRYVIQWNKDDVNFLKLMKIDVLSLGMLTALRKCLELLKETRGISWDLSQIPPDDKATYDMICRAQTVGVFQIESRAQMNCLPRMLPRNYYDLVIEVALIRPGPLQGGMVHPYLKRRQGLEKVTYPHPGLEVVLKKTNGVPLFQEQIMKLAVIAAGFSAGEADELRRLMSAAWKRRGTMSAVRQRVMSGLLANGVNGSVAEQIYKTIEGFGNYGFPESHAASFALLSYASSYFKCHFPDVFTCSILNSQPMGFYPPRVLIAEAQRQGVLVLPLCIQNSHFDYRLEKYIPVEKILDDGAGSISKSLSASHFGLPRPFALRQGFRSLIGISEAVLRRIQSERERHGLYQDLKDFIRRTALPKSIVTRLAAAGAFASLSSATTSVRELLWEIESFDFDQQSFFWGSPVILESKTKSNTESASSSESEEDAGRVLPEETNWETLIREYAGYGFSLNLHPMSVLRPDLGKMNLSLRQQKRISFFSSQDLNKVKSGAFVRLAGLISVTQRPPTANGMCFITLEDEFGFMNIVISPDVYQRDRLTIYQSSFLEVHGTVQKKGAITNILALKILPFLAQQTQGHTATI